MPVTTEKLTAPDGQALTDLSKVLDLSGEQEAAAKIREWQAAGEQLYAGRFNGHLVALLRLNPVDTNAAQIVDITVREITRRRTVGTQLLNGVIKECRAAGNNLSCNIGRHPELADALSRAGFSRAADSDEWFRQNR